MISEQRLVRDAQQGNKRAFEMLYEQHYDAVYKYIYYRVGQRPLAEDLTSDVFERMVAKIDTFEPGNRPLIAWLYTIASNLIKNKMKRQNRLTWLPLDERQSSDEQGVIATIAARLTREQLAAALQQLTEEQRQVIILRFLQDERIKDVAELLGKTETSVKALQRRGIGALRRVLDQEGVHV